MSSGLSIKRFSRLSQGLYLSGLTLLVQGCISNDKEMVSFKGPSSLTGSFSQLASPTTIPSTSPSPAPSSTVTPAPSPTATPTPTPTPTPSPTASATPTPTSSAPAAISISACLPGSGHDYQVGPNAGQLSSLDQVPWENLAAGDTVRIFYKSTPYAGKFMIKAHGTAAAPVRVCGVKGPGGERPIITGANAITRRSLVYGGVSSAAIQESRSIIMIKGDASIYTDYPTYIQIDGLNIRSAYPTYTYTDTAGVSHPYTDFGACIWVDRGQNITIADNEISDCTNGIFTKSTDDGDFAVTKNIRFVGNSIYGHGVVGDVHMHGGYIQSVNVVYEFNHFGPQRAGALGNCLKDRSVGSVVRYNRFDGGAHSMDLVEAEDFPITAQANPAYRSTFVYGNQIKHDASAGSAIHYGGDHYGAATLDSPWGEPIFRKGTLYFFNNTLYSYASSSLYNAVLFQIATTDEHAEVWNNIFYTDKTNISTVSFRGYSEVSSLWTPGGIMNLGKNWVNTGWTDFIADAYRPVGGQLNGTSNLMTGTSSPIDLTTMIPLAGSAVVDAGQAPVSAAAGYSVSYQLNSSYISQSRAVNGSAIDIGAVER